MVIKFGRTRERDEDVAGELQSRATIIVVFKRIHFTHTRTQTHLTSGPTEYHSNLSGYSYPCGYWAKKKCF